jgi:hypothetical protein
MRHRTLLTLSGLLAWALLAAPASAQTFTSGSTGADGAFSPATNTTLTLPPSGVFNFTTVNIPNGVTVKFTRNAANTPVTILATGNVTISGIIDVSGANGVYGAGTPVGTTAGAGGPGGFDGGNGANGTVSMTGGAGRGPGGGLGGTGQNGGAGGGGFVTSGGSGGAPAGSTGGSAGAPYSDATLLPLIGGSGGGGGGANFNQGSCGGGGGGGAILIASSGTITLNNPGRIWAKGGTGASASFSTTPGISGGGSGGAVRLIATTITGVNGTIDVSGGTSSSNAGNVGGAGSAGRVRVEAFTNTLTASFPGASGSSVSSGPPTSVTLANAPSLQITAIGSVTPPANPAGLFFAPDVVLPGTVTNPVTVNIAAANIPTSAVLTVSVVGFIGASTSTPSSALSGTFASSTATASVTLPTNEPAIVAVSATFAVAQLDGQGPLYAHGEPIERVRITADGRGRNVLAFITRSGREVMVSAR